MTENNKVSQSIVSSSSVQEAIKAYDQECAALLQARDAVIADLPEAMAMLKNTEGKVLISGIGKSGRIGEKIVASLSSLGTPAYFLHSTEALHGDSGAVEPGDTAILISNSGTTAEVLAFGTMLKEWGIPRIAMTGEADSPLANLCDCTLRTTVDKEADPNNLAPTSSTTLTLALGDALAVGLSAEKNFSPADFGERHPGGALGEQTSTDRKEN